MLTIRSWVTGLLLMGVFLVASAQEPPCGSKDIACQVPIPVHPEARGARCVESEDFMVRNHMNLILHQRDLTMHNGIRTPKYSLKECVGCHVQQRPNGSYIAINDPGQFCQSCHSYAAVQIDCFECHATTPTVPSATKP